MNEQTQKWLNIREPVEALLSCPQHGDYIGKTQQIGERVIQTPCLACQAEWAERSAAAQQAQLDESREVARQQRLRQAGIPYYLWGAGFDGFRVHTAAQRDALQVARAYAEQFDERVAQGRNLVFCGRVGTGKTHLAAAIGQAVLEHGYSVLMTGAFKLVMQIKDSYRADSVQTTLQAIDRIVDYDLLIVDEMGVQFGSETEKLLMTQVLNGRYEERLPTLVLTNLTEMELAGYLGERLIDRLCDRGSLLIPFDWESYRGARHG